MAEYQAVIREATEYLRKKIDFSPKIGLILGSGWGDFAETMQGALRIPYGEVPGFHTSTVPGHAGEWAFGELSGQKTAMMVGRLHYYEGHWLKDITLPVRVMKQLGVETLIVTNAAGGVNTGFEVGDLMLITDHINMTGVNPLFGPNLDEFGPRFPDMSKAYDPDLMAMAKAVARDQGLNIREGVYAQMTGPSFETPAEIRMLRVLGADAVGMSTVPEVIAARHSGIKVLGVSCITNMAAGVLDQPLSHEEVMEVSNRVKGGFRKFLSEVVRRI